MASVTMLIVVLFLFVGTMAGGEKKKSLDKIIIHVPYKIHKHHHTHTRYKVITIPAPKKEHTVIYLKEQIQPIIKEVPATHPQVEVTATQPQTHYQTPEMIIPPHQQSAQAFLESISDSKIQNPTSKDQQQEYNTIAADQKPLETHILSDHQSQPFIPNPSHNPILLPPHNNIFHQLSFKPVPLSPNSAFPSKLFLNPTIYHSYHKFLPKFTYKPMVHAQGHLVPQYGTKPLLGNAKALQDSVAHTSNQVYKKMMPGSDVVSYKVKEENQEGDVIQLVKHQHISNAIPVPSPKSKRKGKTYVHTGPSRLTKRLPFNQEYEYEHVGYLIIDGNSRKIVGKNFKDELRLSR